MSEQPRAINEMFPAPRLLTLGLQHVLVMYAGAVAVPLIIGRALTSVILSLFFNGVGSLDEARTQAALVAASAEHV